MEPNSKRHETAADFDSKLTFFPYGFQYHRAPTPLPEEWEGDLQRIAEKGYTHVQFRPQWRCHETVRGNYRWDDLDKLFDLVGSHGLRVVLKPMLETAPDWVFSELEGTRIGFHGIPITPFAHGAYYVGGWWPCFDNPSVVKAVSEFVRQLAFRYKDHPALWLEGYDIMLYTIKPTAMTVGSEALLKNKSLSVTDDFRFETEAKNQGLSLNFPQDEIRIVDREKGVLFFKIENTSPQPHEISIYISDSFQEKFSVPGNGFIEKKHLFVPVESDLKRGFIEVTAKLESVSGVFYGRARIPLWQLPSLQISIDTQDTPLFKGECFPVNIEVINNSSQPVSGAFDIKMTGGSWKYADHASASENTLSPFELRKFSLACVAADEKDAAIFVTFAGCRESKNFMVNSCRQEAQAVFATKRPTIDGNLDDWENSFPSIELGAAEDKKTVKFTSAYGGLEDCSGSIFLSWNHDNLYLAAKVKDNIFSQDATAGDIWQGDCIQIALRSREPSKNRGFDESTYVIGLAQASDGPVIFQWHPEMKFIRTGKFVFKREKNVSIYEAAIPWNALGIRAGTMMPITCSMTINDNDGGGFRGWLEWAPGLCGGNDSSLFGKLKLLPTGN